MERLNALQLVQLYICQNQNGKINKSDLSQLYFNFIGLLIYLKKKYYFFYF